MINTDGCACAVLSNATSVVSRENDLTVAKEVDYISSSKSICPLRSPFPSKNRSGLKAKGVHAFIMCHGPSRLRQCSRKD